jgi:hypothetical protein
VTQTWNQSSTGKYEAVEARVTAKDGTPLYTFDFATPNGSGARFGTGFYRRAQRYPSSDPASPGIAVHGSSEAAFPPPAAHAAVGFGHLVAVHAHVRIRALGVEPRAMSSVTRRPMTGGAPEPRASGSAARAAARLRSAAGVAVTASTAAAVASTGGDRSRACGPGATRVVMSGHQLVVRR